MIQNARLHIVMVFRILPMVGLHICLSILAHLHATEGAPVTAQEAMDRYLDFHYRHIQTPLCVVRLEGTCAGGSVAIEFPGGVTVQVPTVAGEDAAAVAARLETAINEWPEETPLLPQWEGMNPRVFGSTLILPRVSNGSVPLIVNDAGLRKTAPVDEPKVERNGEGSFVISWGGPAFGTWDEVRLNFGFGTGPVADEGQSSMTFIESEMRLHLGPQAESGPVDVQGTLIAFSDGIPSEARTIRIIMPGTEADK